MNVSQPRLHRSVALTPDERVAVEQMIKTGHAKRMTRLQGMVAATDAYAIPLGTISRDGNFDAYISLRPRDCANTRMLVDTGNNMLVLPRWEDIAALPNWQNSFTVLSSGHEPWGCPANLVRGPIEIDAEGGSTFVIENCIFYACTADVPNGGGRTANYGAGILSPSPFDGATPLKPPQAFNPDFPFAEFDFEPLSRVMSFSRELQVASGSTLRISKAAPPDYRMLEIVQNTSWMALVPKSLSIGPIITRWPNPARPAIAMIDTGGGPVFLSDPDGYLYNETWPPTAANPGWTAESLPCVSTGGAIGVELGDARTTFSYRLDTSAMTATVSGLTLVMCADNQYMRGQYGINIGGVSALSIGILIDYQRALVGLKSK